MSNETKPQPQQPKPADSKNPMNPASPKVEDPPKKDVPPTEAPRNVKS